MTMVCVLLPFVLSGGCGQAKNSGMTRFFNFQDKISPRMPQDVEKWAAQFES